MNYRKFGKTDLFVSEIGFGAWAIGGAAMAGSTPIGWGFSDDEVSIQTLLAAFDSGINFFDTADFYGLGHSESLIGEVFKDKRKDIIIATKVGHRLKDDGTIFLDYSYDYVIKACEESLRRLKTDVIDIYQLHAAKLQHLEDGGCIEAMDKLQKDGKIRYWGISLNTFNPYPEAKYLVEHKLADSFQVVFNLVNQRIVEVFNLSGVSEYGIIARMPLQWGLLTGKFNHDTTFPLNDHRSQRLAPELLAKYLDRLEVLWNEPSIKFKDKTSLALSFPLSYDIVSTQIPGMRQKEQVLLNTQQLTKLGEKELRFLYEYYKQNFDNLLG